MPDFVARLQEFLRSRGKSLNFQQLTPDASTREYFRAEWDDRPAIVCIYPEPFLASEQSYLDVTKLFIRSGLPVAPIIDFDESLGAIAIADFGDRILREELLNTGPERREELINSAIDLIPRIQAATETAFKLDSIASRLKFDVEKLTWELNFFKEHYFNTLKRQPLADVEDHAITDEFKDLAEELEKRANVLCHRDFHAANLMLDDKGDLKIIDHQDARIGPASYDLVSLLLDRVTELPSPEWLASKRQQFLNGRNALGLESLDKDRFAEEFRLQTVQRCLKAAGTFSYQSANRGKTYFIPFIKPMFRIVVRATENLQRFPVLQNVLLRELEEPNTDR